MALLVLTDLSEATLTVACKRWEYLRGISLRFAQAATHFMDRHATENFTRLGVYCKALSTIPEHT
jgi:hypothetical protein